MKYILAASFTLFLTTAVYSMTPEKIIKGFDVPWGMVKLTDGDFLISERSGTLYRVKPGQERQAVANLPEVNARGQGGLLDLVLHPEYSKNGWIYISYASAVGDGDGDNTNIIRAKINGNALTDVETIYKPARNYKRRFHYGSRMAFDKTGILYFSIGDRGERDVFPQDTDQDGGKIYRVHADGKIPTDNPFADSKVPAAYSYGHRNPQGMALNPVTGDIWAHEHGPRGGDEINIIKAGKNYGWPVISYGINYNGTKFTDLSAKEGMEQPVHQWTPSIAPSGMVFVTSDKYPDWQGKLLIGSLKFNNLELATLDGNKVTSIEKVLEGIGRVRNVVQLNDGFIYVATDGDAIYRLNP